MMEIHTNLRWWLVRAQAGKAVTEGTEKKKQVREERWWNRFAFRPIRGGEGADSGSLFASFSSEKEDLF
jgi:hypothetical protein